MRTCVRKEPQVMVLTGTWPWMEWKELLNFGLFLTEMSSTESS